MDGETYKKTVLDNGIKVITEEVPYFNSASIGFWVNTGSQNEDTSNNGVSHFIEHLFFKGTKNHSASEIAEIMDSVGGHLNAFTEKEQTCYYARVTDRHIPLAFDILSDMLLHSLLAPKDIEKEKGVVLEEIKMYEDSPDEMVFEIFTQGLWDGHPLGRSTLGSREVIKSLTRKDLMKYIGKNYVPQNMIVSAAGRLEHDRIVELVDKLFGKLKKTSVEAFPKTPVVKKKHIVKYKDCEQVYLCMGSTGISARDESKYKLSILDSILGGSMSSRLFQEIRERRGLVYTVMTFQNSYKDAGLFGIYAGTSMKSLKKVMDLCVKIMGDIREKGVSAKELSRAKEHIKGAILLALESTANRMIRLAKGEVYHGRLIPHEEIIEKLEAVTLEDVHKIARKILNYKNYSVAVLGPVDKDFKIEI
ncbi:MAG: insulinase family protein [Firmicutes bacterium]|nr:insulinase family protein [Bacillota bacterium]